MGADEKGEGVGLVDYQIIIPSLDGSLRLEILQSFGCLYDKHLTLNRTMHFKVFERYLCLEYVGEDIPVYTQDDDCVVPVDGVAGFYEPGVVTCNMPQHRRAEYTDGTALVGWGAIFDRNLTGVFNLYLKHFPIDDLFLTECDRVFTGLNRVKMIDVPFVNLENAEGAERLHKRPDHWEKLKEIRERIGFVKRKEGMG